LDIHIQQGEKMNIQAIHSKNGKTYWIEQGDTLYAQRLQAGQYQRSNWDFAQTILPQFRTAIDIGSNNACNAIHYAERFEWVECFEPTQLAQQLWHNTVRDNNTKNVTLHTEALGEHETTTEILLHAKNGGHNHVSHIDKNPRARGAVTRSTQQTVMKRLDDYDFERVDFIKIDVEGYEWFVLQGGEKTIMKERPLLQLEIVANQCRKFNYRAEHMIEWLRDRDYRVCSKRDGWLDGVFEGKHRNDNKGLYHNGIKRKGDMDLFFVPQEWQTALEPKLSLFEMA
jgi:FkbM family methyltransferase